MTQTRLSPLASAAFPALALALLLSASGCSNSDDGPNPGPGPTPSATFVIQPGSATAGSMAFAPARDTVQVGQVVRMTNGDTVTHQINTATFGGPSWGSIGGGGSRDATATTAGTFTFICTIQGHTMSGVLVVLP
jgi:plastocyanin